MKNQDNFQRKALDWRESIRHNQRNTRFVILLFILIYLVVGFIIDTFLVVGSIDPTMPIPYDSITSSLLTFKIIPVATLIMLGVAILSITLAILFNNNIMMMGTNYYEVKGENFNSHEEQQLYNVIEELKIAAGLNGMPKIYIIEADYMNAFASGFSEKSSMVAITRGLLEKLNRSELQAVMAHELSHIRHNDIRLTMMVLILSNLILIVIDIFFRWVIYGRSRDNRLAGLIITLRFLLPVITLLLMLYLSRTREYMADAGSVELTRDNEPLANALMKIHADHQENFNQYEDNYGRTPNEEVRTNAYFYDPRYAGITTIQSINNLFSTHPPLEKRLEALGFKRKISENNED